MTLDRTIGVKINMSVASTAGEYSPSFELGVGAFADAAQRGRGALAAFFASGRVFSPRRRL
jgi:hypothetical protein